MNVLRYTIEYFQNECVDINVLAEQYIKSVLLKQSSLLVLTCQGEKQQKLEQFPTPYKREIINCQRDLTYTD